MSFNWATILHYKNRIYITLFQNKIDLMYYKIRFLKFYRILLLLDYQMKF